MGFNGMAMRQPNWAPNPILLWQPMLPSQEATSPSDEVVDPLTRDLRGTGPWAFPSAADIRHLLQGRTLAYFGDSICGQQSLSAAYLLFCNGNETVKYNQSGLGYTFPSFSAEMVALVGGQFLGFSDIKAR